MKISLITRSNSENEWKTDELKFLGRHLELEGDVLVPPEESELVVSNCLVDRVGERPHILSGQRWYRHELAAIGIEVSQWDTSDFFVTKWWDGEKWGYQTFLGIPTMGLMDEEKSVQVTCGCCGTWLGATSKLVEAFYPFEGLLKQIGHLGFVSLKYAMDGKLVGVETGVPGFGLYNILTGVKEKISTFLLNPYRVIESWTVSLLVSRWPWPECERRDDEKVQIHGLSESVERHFWMTSSRDPETTRFRDLTHTSATTIGVATGWAKTLAQANSFAVLTANNVGFEESQFRTDANRYGGLVFGRVRELGLL